jgi:hypothetical protein
MDELEDLRPDHVFDGGDLDCGSGLVLLIREHMRKVPEGGILEMRSVESTVAGDLPPWCRMVGHHYLGHLAGDSPSEKRFFVRKGAGEAAQLEERALEEDKERARQYEWRLRARASGHRTTTVYCRNFQWAIGQPASFEEKDAHPSAVEAMLGALAADLVTSFATASRRSGLRIDDIEVAARGRLNDPMAILGLSDGDPSFAAIELKLFASTFDDGDRVRETWNTVVARSPLVRTLERATDLTCKIAIV